MNGIVEAELKQSSGNNIKVCFYCPNCGNEIEKHLFYLGGGELWTVNFAEKD